MTLRETFDRRAQALATRAEDTAPVELIDVMVCRIGDRRYAIELRDLVEVSRHRPPAVLPGFAPVVAGLITVRGRLVLAIDLARLLGAAAVVDRPAGVFLSLRDGESSLGFAVDAVEDMRRLDRAALIAATDAGDESPVVPYVTADRVSLVDVGALVRRFSAVLETGEGPGT